MSMDFQLVFDAFGKLVLTLSDGTVHTGVTVVRAFPIAAASEGVSILGANGRELVWIDRWSLVSPTLLGIATFGLGWVLQQAGHNTNPMQMLVWGFFISTVLLYHGTYTINSLSHVFGSQRFHTGDDSRNNGLLALITLGEGWHNNHHHCQSSCRQGIYWWEVDITFLALSVLAKLGLVWDLRPVPQSVYDQADREALARRR